MDKLNKKLKDFNHVLKVIRIRIWTDNFNFETRLSLKSLQNFSEPDISMKIEPNPKIRKETLNIETIKSDLLNTLLIEFPDESYDYELAQFLMDLIVLYHDYFIIDLVIERGCIDKLVEDPNCMENVEGKCLKMSNSCCFTFNDSTPYEEIQLQPLNSLNIRNMFGMVCEPGGWSQVESTQQAALNKTLKQIPVGFLNKDNTNIIKLETYNGSSCSKKEYKNEILKRVTDDCVILIADTQELPISYRYEIHNALPYNTIHILNSYESENKNKGLNIIHRGPVPDQLLNTKNINTAIHVETSSAFLPLLLHWAENSPECSLVCLSYGYDTLQDTFDLHRLITMFYYKVISVPVAILMLNGGSQKYNKGNGMGAMFKFNGVPIIGTIDELNLVYNKAHERFHAQRQTLKY